MDKILNQYKDYIKNDRKLSKNTIISYENDIKKYFEYARLKNMDIINVNENELLGFSIYLQSIEISVATLSRMISSIKSFYEFMHEKGIISNNPAKGLKKPKIQSGQIQILSQEEIEMFLENVSANSHIGLRDKALLEVLYGTGMKVSEIISIDMDDLDVEMEYINYNCTGSSRVIPLGKLSLESVKEYIVSARSQLIADPSQSALFVNSKGERLTRQGIWKIIKKHAQNAGISKSVTPSVIRNSFAVHMIQNGANIKIVSQMLGNSTMSCIQAYMETVSKSTRKEIKDKHPRG